MALTIEEKKVKIRELRAYHRDALEKIGSPDAVFIPRMAYKPTGHNEVVISFFASELKGETDIYTEFVSRDLVSEDPERTLWKWKYNPFWDTEYATSNHDGNVLPSSVLYYIPTSELIVISKYGVIKEEKIVEPDIKKPEIAKGLSSMLKKETVTAGESILDKPIKDLTLRDLMLILNLQK